LLHRLSHLQYSRSNQLRSQEWKSQNHKPPEELKKSLKIFI
jgi:hypothetical protein